MDQKTDSIHVTMHVLSRKNATDLKADQAIQRKVDVAMHELMQPVKTGGELAKRLALPASVPVKWDVKIAALNEGFKSLEGHIPVMVSIGGVPNVMEKLRPEMIEEVTNLIFKEMRKETTQSKDLAKTLGYETEKPAKFHLYMPHQVRMRGPAPAHLQGDGDGDGGVSGSWSKGCSSWPW
jgi:hypothetical protein